MRDLKNVQRHDDGNNSERGGKAGRRDGGGVIERGTRRDGGCGC